MSKQWLSGSLVITALCQPVSHLVILHITPPSSVGLEESILTLSSFSSTSSSFLSSSSSSLHKIHSWPAPSGELLICRCDRGGRCVHNAAGVWLLRLHLSEGQSIPTPFLPIKAFHSYRQTRREGRREEQRKERENCEWHERSLLTFLPLVFLFYPPWTHCLASGSNPRERGEWEERIESGRWREKGERSKQEVEQ